MGKKMTDRMTEYSLEELIKMASGSQSASCLGFVKTSACCGARGIPKDEMPLGAIMNEVGVIFLNEGSSRAEDVLAGLFDRTDEPNIAGLGYFYLSQRKPTLKPATRAKVDDFEKNQANSATIARVNARIAELTA